MRWNSRKGCEDIWSAPLHLRSVPDSLSGGAIKASNAGWQLPGSESTTHRNGFIIEVVKMLGPSRSAMGRAALIVSVLVGSASCDSSGRSDQVTPPAQSASASTSEAKSLDGVWSTGPVPIEDVRAAMLAAGLSEKDVDGWINDQRSPPEITFELQFDFPNFSHSREDVHFPLSVDESGTYAFANGELRLSLPDLGDAYVFDATLSDDTLSLELVDQKETGTSENAKTHLIWTTALYASAPFVRQP